jgi:hypothetical protein
VPADDLARAAVDRGHQVAPAVLGHPHAGHVQVPELVGPLDGEVPRSSAAIEPATALDQAPLAHDAQHALAVDGATELSDDQRGEHPVAVGLVVAGDVNGRLLDVIGRRALTASPGRPGLRDAVDRLAADLRDARHHRGRVALGDELAGPGDAHA